MTKMVSTDKATMIFATGSLLGVYFTWPVLFLFFFIHLFILKRVAEFDVIESYFSEIY